MAKKADLLLQAAELGLDVSAKDTIPTIEKAIAAAPTKESKAAEETKEVAPEAEPKLAKSGKRSAKALAEEEEKTAKETRKASEQEPEEEKKKNPAPKTRPRSERRSKKYKEAYAKIDPTTVYSLAEALKLAVATSTTKFDSSVEFHIKLGVDPRQADQNIRDSLVLPEGTGKDVRVAVFAEDDDVAKAKAAGAEVAGNEEFLQQLDAGTIDFDVLVASPQVMARLSKYARILGPKGLMPNPKSGTVSADVAKAVKEAKAGKVEYRLDETGIIHTVIGKVSFGDERLGKNAAALVASVKANKPATVKGVYIETVFISTTMGPSIKVTID